MIRITYSKYRNPLFHMIRIQSWYISINRRNPKLRRSGRRIRLINLRTIKRNSHIISFLKILKHRLNQRMTIKRKLSRCASMLQRLWTALIPIVLWTAQTCSRSNIRLLTCKRREVAHHHRCIWNIESRWARGLKDHQESRSRHLEYPRKWSMTNSGSKKATNYLRRWQTK